MTPIVTTDWLADHLDDPDIVVCDCSFYLPNDPRNAAGLFAEARIPGARFFDIDAIKDATSDLPHMLPSPGVMAEHMGRLGISNAAKIIFYDQLGLFSAARGWWMMRVFGHDRAAVLDGGLPKWRAEGRPLDTSAPVASIAAVFTPAERADLVRDLTAMKAIVEDGSALILDARPDGRFAGTAPEPRAGVRGGHMPGAHNIPFNQLLAADGTMLPPDQLRARFVAEGADGSRPVVTSCGTGVTAAVLTLGLAVAGLPEGALYDGSWTEWGGRPDTQVEAATDAG
ncbi:3-mercaptopyruvate sulfurtransferase [Acidisoma cellulosilytica]|uniref:3-mercaptopyruvate sulfurtransferase n=1 Tax=Acidisoma cellulosilyticum TaxID=2802395 RepID=A0A963Z1I1_9PROT|nr:3-mercaptopyruvate sulfurtransferase [Acidisoma cellulosilyticum]MCB8880809.1 3-mercaptopyruvate sulfurtransferase [Acidisoma cellulosilyticum]